MTVPKPLRIILPIAVVAGIIFLITRGGANHLTMVASGTVEATEADLGFDLPGRIAAIAVQEGDRVQAGDTLAGLDLDVQRASARAADAQVSAARARLDELQRGARPEEIAQAAAALDAAQQRLTQATADLARSRTLFEGGAIARELLDHHQTAVELARADVDRTREALRLVREGPRQEQIAAARARLDQAIAAAEQVRATLAHGRIVAPFDGLITNRHREPGETAGAGLPVLSLMNPARRWVRIYVRADAVGRIAIGEPVTIRADAYPDRTFEGEIVYLADEAEFTPRNVQTSEERVKLVYEVRIRITSDPGFDLKPGLTADVELPGPPGS